MRAVTLSNDTVISLLNNYFVPVYTSGEDYGGAGSAPAEEKQAWEKIYHAAHAKMLRVGSVFGYITTPEGDPIDTLYTGGGSAEALTAALQKTIEKLGTREGKTLVEPRPQNPPPKAEPDALVLHLVARQDHQSSWQKFPAENWLAIDKSKWTKFLPPAGLEQGKSWEIDPNVSRNLLTFFYPGTEDTRSDQVGRNVIELASIRAKVVSVEGRMTRLQLEASLKMTRPFYPNHPEHKPVPIEATAIGFVEVDSSKPSIRSFLMATESATFGGKKFSVAVRSHP